MTDAQMEVASSTNATAIPASTTSSSHRHHRRRVPGEEVAWAHLVTLDEATYQPKSIHWYERVFKAYPQLRLRREAETQELILHKLTWCGQSKEADTNALIQLLLARSPHEQLLALCNEHLTPLLLLANCSTTQRDGLVEQFLRLCPESAFISNNVPLAPLHLLCLNEDDPITINELLAFQQYAPLSFTIQTALEETVLGLYCRTRAAIVKKRVDWRKYRPVEEVAFRRKLEDEADVDVCTCVRLILQGYPQACVMNDRNGIWPHEHLMADDCCVPIILEAAVQFSEARGVKNGYGVLHWICELSSTTQSSLPLLQLALTLHPHLANARTEKGPLKGALPLELLLVNEMATIEQIICLYDATSLENIIEISPHSPLFCQVARAPNEAERFEQVTKKDSESEKASTTDSAPLSSASVSPSSILPFPPSAESRRTDLLSTLLKMNPTWAEQTDSELILPLCRAIARPSLTHQQLQLLWSATPLRIRQAMIDGRSILHELILRLAAECGPQDSAHAIPDERILLLETAQRLLMFDCHNAFSVPDYLSSNGLHAATDNNVNENDADADLDDWSAVWLKDPTKIVVDYPLLFLRAGNVADVMDGLFLAQECSICEDADVPGTVAPTDTTPSTSSSSSHLQKLQLHPAAHTTLTHVNALGRTLFLQRLTHHAVPLRLPELEWFGSHAAFVFEQIATDGSNVLHLLVERSDCTIEMINYVMTRMDQGNHSLHDARTGATVDASFTARTGLNKLPVDLFVASPRVSNMNLEDANEVHQVMNIIQTLIGWNLPGATSIFRDLLLETTLIDSTPNHPFHRPIHSYLHALDGRPRCAPILKLLLGWRDSQKDDPSTSTSNSISTESLAVEVLKSRGVDHLTPLMLLCSSPAILTLDEFEWIASLRPNLMATLLGQTDGDHRTCLHRLAGNKQLTPELWSRVLSHATDETLSKTLPRTSKNRYEPYGQTCAHVLCATHNDRLDLVLALLERSTAIFSIPTIGWRRRDLSFPLGSLTHGLLIDQFQSLMEGLPASLRLDPLSIWAYDEDLADSQEFYNYASSKAKHRILTGWTGTDGQFLPLRWLLRISGLNQTQLFTDAWTSYLPRLILFAMESNENCQKLFHALSESSPEIDEGARQCVVRMLYQTALFTGTSVTPHLSLRDAQSVRGLFADVKSEMLRDRTRSLRPFYLSICVLFYLSEATQRSLSGPAARRTFLNDIKSGRLFQAALTPLASLRMAEAIHTYALEKGIWPKGDLPSTHHVSNLPTWPSLIHTERGRYVFASIFISLIRSKERRLIIELMRLIAPVHVGSLQCPQTKTAPLHILCNQVRGCREKIFLILLKDTLQAFDGSYEHVLALVDENGMTLDAVLRKPQNRLLREEFNYQRNRTGSYNATLKTESAIQSVSSDSLVASAASSGPTAGLVTLSSRLHSRGNFLTYDHIVTIPLANCLEESKNSVLPTTHLHPLSILQVNSLLTPTECAKLIDTTGLQDSLLGEYRPDERDATRLLCSSNDLAESLWQRLQPVIHSFLDRESSRRPMGFGTFGQWRPVGLNSCFRFSNYQPGSSGFIPHRDAAFVAATNERSIFTLLIYLNTCGSQEQTDDGKHCSLGGTTSFYESTHFTPGGLIRDEGIRRVLTLPAVCGSAIIFPHETIHSGDPISMDAPHGKYILRTDLIFHRYTPLPLQPFELNWRNEPNYLCAVELFQAAFKHELAGREMEASEAYERSLSWRVAEILPKLPDPVTRMIRDRDDESYEDISEVFPRRSIAGPAMRLNSDCLRLIYTYLDKESMVSARCVGLVWWTQLFPKSSAGGGAGSKALLHQYEALWPTQMNISKAPSISTQAESSSTLASTSSVSLMLKPPESTRKQKVVRSSVRPKLSNDFSAFSSTSLADRLLIMPRMSQVGGISCLFSYPADIFAAHPSGCRRTMAIYTALTLSHQLPTILFDPPNIYETKSHDVAWPPLTASQTNQAEALLGTRIVLSYNRSSSLIPGEGDVAGGGSVEWCRFDRLLHAVFHGHDIITQISSLKQFNQQLSSETTFTTRVRGWTFGEQSIPSGGMRPRYSVTFDSILPSFYHAAMCCSKQHAPEGTRHELCCYDKRHMVAEKQLKQSMARRAVRISNAEEVRTLDSVTHSHIHPVGVTTSTISSPPAPTPSATPFLVTVQETRSSCFLANFRTSFIGIPCI